MTGLREATLSNSDFISHRKQRAYGFAIFILFALLMLGGRLYASEQSGTVMTVVDADSYAVTPFVSILEDENSE